MSFTGSVTRGEHLIFVRGGTVVDARAVDNRELQLGGSALLDARIARGLPVEQATFNVNFWDVYRGDDPEVVHILLERIYQLEQEREDLKNAF